MTNVARMLKDTQVKPVVIKHVQRAAVRQVYYFYVKNYDAPSVGFPTNFKVPVAVRLIKIEPDSEDYFYSIEMPAYSASEAMMLGQNAQIVDPKPAKKNILSMLFKGMSPK